MTIRAKGGATSRRVMLLALCVAYFLVLACLLAFGLHRLHLVYLCRRHEARIAEAPALAAELAEHELPRVTVQLPLFNEATVAARLIRAVGRIDYPRDRLEIQVLDDSTDDTWALSQSEVALLVDQGIDAVCLHRTDRTGYKAGALDAGLRVAKGDLVAVFDADFLPDPGFLRAIVGHFADPKVGMVQTRWGHLNREASVLTQVQALTLDGHHLVENRARYGAGLFFNFSGTGGIWRKEAIHEAGGWQHDTLTEDLDLSYRAQLVGWRFVYRQDVVSPQELPEDISALRAQQHRWAKGTVQTARKLLGRIFRDPTVSMHQRVEALFHMTPYFTYPLLVALCVLLLPAIAFAPSGDVHTMLLIDLPLCATSTSSLALFYATAESAQGRSRWGAIRRIPHLIALGAGMAPHLSRGVWEGLRHMAGEFVRTPKKGDAKGSYRARLQAPWAELVMAAVTGTTAVLSLFTGHYLATPFALLFASGFGYVAALVIAEQLGRRPGALPGTASSHSAAWASRADDAPAKA